MVCFFFSSRRRHTRSLRDWSSDVCSSDLRPGQRQSTRRANRRPGGQGSVSVQVEQKRLTAPGGRWPAEWARRQARPLVAWVLLAVLVATGVSTSASFRSGPVLMETLKGATFVGMASAAQFFAVVGGGIDLSVGSVATLSGMFAAVIMNGHDHAIPLAV